MTKFAKWKKMIKIKARFISKPHAHLQTMEKTCAKFEKDRYKTVWGVALTRCPLSIHWGQKMTKFTKWKKWQKIISQLYSNHMHILIPWRKRTQSFIKIGIKLYEELGSQSTHCLYTFMIWGQEMTKFIKWKNRSNFGEVDFAPAKTDKVNKVEKWQKLTAGLNPNHMHIFKPWKKRCAKLHKDRHEIV